MLEATCFHCLIFHSHIIHIAVHWKEACELQGLLTSTYPNERKEKERENVFSNFHFDLSALIHVAFYEFQNGKIGITKFHQDHTF